MRQVKLIGVPSSAGHREETAEAPDQSRAPQVIRESLAYLLKGFDIPVNFTDLGDIKTSDQVDFTLKSVELKLSELLSENFPVIVLGGAHTITLGSLRAVSKIHKDYSLIYFDAHPDLMPRDTIDYGSSLYHAVREKVVDPKRLVFLGARIIERAEDELIKKYQIKNYDPLAFQRMGVGAIYEEILRNFPPPYYISFDLDSVDPTFAPGVTTLAPVGLNAREVFCLSSDLCATGQVIGVEIVELSPINDKGSRTAYLAAQFLQHISTVLAAN